MAEQGPTVFVSWAHHAPNWTTEQAEAWQETVRHFTDALRLAGVDADIDLYQYHDPEIDWTRYGTLAIERADTTIIAMSPAWAERWRGSNPPTVGAGAAREADALHGRFDEDQRHFQSTVKIVILPGATKADIPEDLRRVTSFEISDFSPESMVNLLRTLHRKPQYLRPELGPTPDLPPAPRVTPVNRVPSTGGLWRAIPTPLPPVRTPLDERDRGYAHATLELQLLREPGAHSTMVLALHQIGSELAARLRAERPASGLGQRHSVQWEVQSQVGPQQATAIVRSRFPGDEVVPDFLAYLAALRDGGVITAMQLRRNVLGAKATEQSLTDVTGKLLEVGYELLPGTADVVPILRLGPMNQVSPGDPGSLQGSGSMQASMPWSTRGNVATTASDAVGRHHLGSATNDIAAELVAQLAVELDQPRAASADWDPFTDL